jgi:hypothetical protein
MRRRIESFQLPGVDISCPLGACKQHEKRVSLLFLMQRTDPFALKELDQTLMGYVIA